jgi:hypothetical protein
VKTSHHNASFVCVLNQLNDYALPGDPVTASEIASQMAHGTCVF